MSGNPCATNKESDNAEEIHFRLGLFYGVPSDFTVGLEMWIGFLVNIADAEFILWREREKGSVIKTAQLF